MSETFEDASEERVAHSPVQAMEINTYRYGEEIIREGDVSPYFFVILSGQVRISYRGKKVRLLEDQDVFGLENVVFMKPATYTARALTRSRIAAYGPGALDHLVRESPRMVQSVLVSTLQQLQETTHNLTESPDSFSLDDVRVQFFSDGDLVIQEGSSDSDFYRLVSTQGGLRVSIGEKEISRISNPGEFFGEIAGLLHLPRQATVTSVGDSVVEAYNIDDLDIIIRDYPEVALQMMRTLVTRLVDANRKLTAIGSSNDPLL